MAYEEKYKAEMPHNIIMEGRERLSVSGVEDVESFDEETIVLYTSKGMLIIKGENLHIDKLSLEVGDLSVEGFIDCLRYEDEGGKKSGESLISRLFK